MSFETSPYEGYAAAAVATNGTTAAPEPSVVPTVAADPGSAPRRLPRHQAWLRMGDEGENAELMVLVNFRYPDRLNAEFASFDNERIIGALRIAVVEHNGWCDPYTGDLLPPASQKCARENADQEYRSKLRDIERRRRKLDVARQAEDANRAEIALQLDELTDEREAADEAHAEAVKLFEKAETCCFWHKLDGEDVLRILKAINVERGKVVSSILDGKKS